MVTQGVYMCQADRQTDRKQAISCHRERRDNWNVSVQTADCSQFNSDYRVETNWINSVNTLTDSQWDWTFLPVWVQCEYSERTEMSISMYHRIYPGRGTSSWHVAELMHHTPSTLRTADINALHLWVCALTFKGLDTTLTRTLSACYL